ncbi:phosphoadenylyl-sulfate reductase [Paraferrimonas haliotis]|uniref:Phosphoadenosine 5'-phosphosulfate reductase n=1 Tax=Paraferrimonas haliotis TaxID=2013866 RepID=A0AA37TV48_9GAMM|nr:phosphoadenylyl-sulfate reductase [Paraferrimonas haliotis]GLS83185.1 phosphoadenosine phosphosulfate reductase [Paraferrimonas haliotis]
MHSEFDVAIPSLETLTALDKAGQQQALQELNELLANWTPQQRMAWAVNSLPGNKALSSSFGIQSALLLHMSVNVQADIPVILTDTGYLFDETYQFVDELTQRFGLNLHVYRSRLSPAWQEARYGQLWLKGLDGLEQYNKMNKVEPMNRALAELNTSVWIAGLRRVQSDTRQQLPILSVQNGRYKLLPIVDWDNQQVHQYLTDHQLPYHPLWQKGYVSVGDTHTSKPLEPGELEQDTRFFGLKRECGLHFDI